ncbi:MAG: AAA family ATPase [Ruminococcus sp.]|nr:AAA family ATPase [Ruminococcus sp.]
MGIYLNPGNDLFKMAVNSEIYVDKTMLINFTNHVIGTEQKEICVSRPRRFGKSIAENMLVAYYSKGCDSRELFSKFKIAQTPDFGKHLNQYNVIHIDIQKFISRTKNVNEMLAFLQKRVLKELKHAFPCIENDETSLITALEDFYSATHEQIIFIIDEWDCIFRIHKDNASAQKQYLDFLRDLLKGQPYVALVYMTGILPIKKYGEHSALNMFKEYSMTNQKRLAEFTGFTEDEVKELCEAYQMPFERMKQWYDGYNVNGISIYNPNSVVEALLERIFDNYWSQTENYEALRFYILRNQNGLRDKIIRMISGEHISVNTRKFQNDMCTFESADDILTLLIHLGYLTYDFDTKTAWIPNTEVQQEFITSIQDNGFDHVMESIQKSDLLLKYTLEQNAKMVAEILDEEHTENTSIIKYNDENSLSCVMSLAYYSARDTYAIYRELQGGKGYADLVLVPRMGNSNPAMIIELKWEQTAGIALEQIKERGYVKSLKDYHGQVLFVGVNYDKQTKNHECRFETIEM